MKPQIDSNYKVNAGKTTLEGARELVFLGVKVPQALADLLDQAVLSDSHITKSEYIRDALRQALHRQGFTLEKMEEPKLARREKP